MRRAFVVVDLGFGDAGKGLVTDALVRHHGAHTVVRFNGGAQAGHNVITPDGRHHTFAQLGAGTFVPGVHTVLGREFVVHPGALGEELRHLRAAGVGDAASRLHISRDALVITPYHQAAGRLRERLRGDARHGSCGIGFGEAVGDARNGEEDVLRIGDLGDTARSRKHLRAVAERKRSELAAAASGAMLRSTDARRELATFEDPGLDDAFLAQARKSLEGVACEEEERLLARLGDRDGVTIFEGAQGVLLDEDFGFHPHTTWSHCTFRNATRLLQGCGYDGAVTRLGVTRSFMVRHGAGPFPTEDAALDTIAEPHNAAHPWQGTFRRGALDLVLLRYAIAACEGVDGVVVTHLDAGRDHDLRVCRAYQTRDGQMQHRLDLPPEALGGDERLAWQERLGQDVAAARPVLEPIPHASSPSTWRSIVEGDLGVPFAGHASGPTAAHVVFDR